MLQSIYLHHLHVSTGLALGVATGLAMGSAKTAAVQLRRTTMSFMVFETWWNGRIDGGEARAFVLWTDS